MDRVGRPVCLSRGGRRIGATPVGVSHADRVLLTDEIGAATEGRLTGHSIETVETDGDTATVAVTLEQDGVRSEQVFSLTRSGRTLLVFPEWALDHVGHRTAQVYLPASGSTLEVNGTLVDLADVTVQADPGGLDYVDLPVLPGSCTIAYQSPSEFLASLPNEFAIDAAPGAGAGALLPVAEALEPTEAGHEAITAEVTAMLDECAEQTVPAPEGCPFSAFVWASDIEGEWEIVSYPELSVEPTDDGTFRVYSGGGEGQATFTCLTETFSGEVERTDEPWISISAVVTFPEDGGLELEFL